MKEEKVNNPFQSPIKLWRVEFNTRYKNISLLELIFEEQAAAFSCYEIESNEIEALPDDLWKFISYFPAVPNKESLILEIREYLEGEIAIHEEKEEDWVSKVQSEAKPTEAWRFYIANSKIIDQCPEGFIPISIDAGRAFGTGEHATTKGCLEMLAEIRSSPKKILDVGTGTGVLAIAAKKLWPEAIVVGTDIDEVAVQIASQNAVLNRATIDFQTSYNIKQELAQFDLIISNILASPLIEMKSDFYKMLNSKGKLIVSGFIENQQAKLTQEFEAIGFIVKQISQIEDWRIMLFTKN